MKSNHNAPMHVKFFRNGDTRRKAEKDTPYEVRVVPPHLLKDAASPMEYFALTEGLAPSCLSVQIIWRLSSIAYNSRRPRSMHVDFPAQSCRWRPLGTRPEDPIERIPKIEDRLSCLRFGEEPVDVETRQAEFLEREGFRKLFDDLRQAEDLKKSLAERRDQYQRSTEHVEKELEQHEKKVEVRREEFVALCQKLNITLPIDN
jgi:hypothetical protein